MEAIITTSAPPPSQSAIKTLNIENGTVKSNIKCQYGVNMINSVKYGYLAHVGAKKDVYASYFAPQIKWKCRLNSPISTKFVTSDCESFIFAGDANGNISAWNSLGELLSTTKAHYRRVTNLAFLSNGSYLMSAGDDGVCHLWNLIDLCSIDTDTHVEAVHSWSEHHLSITSLIALPNNFMVSASLDRLIVIMEGCNGQTISRISLPSAIQVVASDQQRIYAGAMDGTIYCIDLTAHAAKSTSESAKLLSDSTKEVMSLKGHDRPVTALALISDKLISGAQNGEIRIWDLHSRCAVKVISPFTSEVKAHTSNSYPITSILPAHESDREQITIFSSKKKSAEHNKTAFAYQPLQRFRKEETDMNTLLSAPTALLDDGCLKFWGHGERKRAKLSAGSRGVSNQIDPNDSNHDEVAMLKQALVEAENKIERWEKVNNKLAVKLKKASSR